MAIGDTLANSATIRTHCCAQCWGALVEKYIDGEWVVVCPRGCQPGGFVTKSYAERRKSESIADLYDVYHNLPALRPASTRDASGLFQDDF